MNDILFMEKQIMTDAALQAEIGKYVKGQRLWVNKTQDDVAREADISRSTLSLLERGETVTLTTLIRVLRVLNALHVFNSFEITSTPSPLTMAKLEQTKRKRANNSSGNTTSSKTDW